ncbi:calcium-binding protein [Thioclava sp. FR2]|uniref:calcium-binding protein n=1 Tax=Thioclava sp. FR2 TaxID=3445780 RepID=UPI003EBC8420
MLEFLIWPLFFAGALTYSLLNDGDDSGSGGDSDPPPETPTTEEDLIDRFGEVLADWDGQQLREGTAGADSLTGTDGGDYIIGGTGADTLAGGAGNDVLDHDFSGPQGNHPQDTWYDDGNADSLSGGADDDVLRSGSGDTVSGGEGADRVDHFVDRDPTVSGDGFADYDALRLEDFTSGEDQLNITLDLEDDSAPGENYLPRVELRTGTDGEIEIWASVARYLTGAHTGTGEEVVSPFMVASLAAGSTIALADINVAVFWNEVS